MRRKYWFMIFLLILCIINVVISFTVNPYIGFLMCIIIYLLLGLMVISFDRFPKSKWTVWWNKNWKGRKVEN
jgi:Flp pilus assembly protein TadB